VRPERAFIAERIAAQHCAELLRAGPPPADLLPLLARTAERLARQLASALEPLCAAPPSVTAQPPVEATWAELGAEIAPLAATTLFAAGPGNAAVLLSVEGAAVLRLVDLAYGGRGTVPPFMPEAFPLSAELLVERLTVLLSAEVAAAFGLGDGSALTRRSTTERASELEGIAPATRLAVVRFEVTEGKSLPWQIVLALPVAALAALVGPGERIQRGPRAADPAAAPFADLPLPLHAVLVDMRLPLFAISELEVGTVLPVAVARSVPLGIGSVTIARGTIGAQDDRVALKLTGIA
jgi:flagellar motor switch protein FliM